MSEMSAELLIGGPISEELVSELAKRIIYYAPSEDFSSDRLVDEGHAIEAIEAAACEGRPLRLTDESLKYGHFREIEAFCEEHRIAFRAHAEAASSLDAELLVYRPATMQKPIEASADSDGEPLLRLKDLERFRNIQAARAFLVELRQEMDPLSILEPAPHP